MKRKFHFIQMLHLSDRLYRCYAMLTNVSSHTRTTHGRTYAHTQINQMRENEIHMQTKRQSQPRRDLIRRTDDSFFIVAVVVVFVFTNSQCVRVRFVAQSSIALFPCGDNAQCSSLRPVRSHCGAHFTAFLLPKALRHNCKLYFSVLVVFFSIRVN